MNTTIPLDEERAGLLMRLIAATRNAQNIAALSEAQLLAATDDWHEALSDVPTSELTFLRLRGVRRGLKSAAEFVALWEETQRGRREQQHSELLAQEHEALRRFEESVAAQSTSGQPESSERRTFRAQGERLKKGLTALCCHCQSEHGHPLAAVLDRTGTVWECVNGACDFYQEVEEEKA